MHDARTNSALLLLTAFLIGGLLAPSVHRLQHAQAFARQRASEAAYCRDHAHDRPNVEADLPALDGLVCPPYHSLSFGLQIVAPAAARQQAVAALVAHVSESLFSVTSSHRFIRGPPLAA